MIRYLRWLFLGDELAPPPPQPVLKLTKAQIVRPTKADWLRANALVHRKSMRF